MHVHYTKTAWNFDEFHLNLYQRSCNARRNEMDLKQTESVKIASMLEQIENNATSFVIIVGLCRELF